MVSVAMNSTFQDEKRQVAFADIKKLFQSITKEAKELFGANQFRTAFVKFKKVDC